jgi:hypothetical protein
MSDFHPVDHKESDAEYVALVRTLVGKRIGAELLRIEDPAELIGRWRSSLTHAPDGDYDVEHLEDGTLAIAAELPDSKPGRWTLKSEAYIQTTWVPPMPDYGIEEESWNQEAYRCTTNLNHRELFDNVFRQRQR